jgi:hypothetical protein
MTRGTVNRDHRTRRLLRGVAAGALALGLLSTTPGVAQAADVSIQDPRGDAPSSIDITQARFELTERWVSMRLRVDNLRTTGRFRMEANPLNSIADRVDVSWRDGKPRARYYFLDYEDGNPDVHPQPCRRMTVGWLPGKDVLRLRLPRACTTLYPGYNPYVFQAFSFLGDSRDTTRRRKVS